MPGSSGRGEGKGENGIQSMMVSRLLLGATGAPFNWGLTSLDGENMP